MLSGRKWPTRPFGFPLLVLEMRGPRGTEARRGVLIQTTRPYKSRLLACCVHGTHSSAACALAWISWLLVCLRTRRLHAFCMALLLCILLAVAGPHQVHHFTESYPQDDQHTRDGGAQRLPDCLIFSLVQQTPVTAECAILLPVLLQARALPVVEPLLWQPEGSRDVSQARAPPRYVFPQHSA
jgi:hypothetical protein